MFNKVIAGIFAVIICGVALGVAVAALLGVWRLVALLWG
jgi:hypothetical protein